MPRRPKRPSAAGGSATLGQLQKVSGSTDCGALASIAWMVLAACSCHPNGGTLRFLEEAGLPHEIFLFQFLYEGACVGLFCENEILTVRISVWLWIWTNIFIVFVNLGIRRPMPSFGAAKWSCCSTIKKISITTDNVP